MNIKRVPPHSKESEQATLATIMLEEKTFDVVENMLSVDDFYIPSHQHIFRKMLWLKKESKPVDVVTVIGALSDEEIDKCGGIEYISSIVDIIPNFRNIEYYAEIVKDNSNRRKIIGSLVESIENLYQPDSDYNDIIAKIEMERKSAKKLKSITPYEVHDVVTSKLNDFMSCKITGFKTGLKSLDKTFSGLNAGLYVIGGRSSVGKSEFARGLSLGLAKNGTRVFYQTLEDGIELASIKLISYELGADIYSIMNNWIPKEDIYEAQNIIESVPIWFNDVRFNISELKNEVRIRRKEVDVLVVDQLSFIESDKKEIRLQFDENIRGLQSIAKEFELPVIALVQINRGVEQRVEKRPTMSDIKESGSIEECADAIMLLYRENYYDKNSLNDVMEIDIAKNKLTD